MEKTEIVKKNICKIPMRNRASFIILFYAK